MLERRAPEAKWYMVGKPFGVKGGPREVAKQVALLSALRMTLRACLHWMEMGLKPGELQGFPEEPGGPLLRVGWAVELSWASS